MIDTSIQRDTAGHACLQPQGMPCPNHWASRLNGTVPQRRVGTGIVLRIMSGDTLAYSTRAIYTQPHSSAWNTAQTIATMASALATAFVGPAATPFDGKAHLLTNGQTIINTTAFQSAIQHQQAHTPANNTPRAFLKALFFDEQLALTDSAFVRVDRGANAVHTYSGQRTASANGYVYVYVTNESGQDVWFDDLMVTHRTGPLLQEAHFYPFGQEISPLSSRAMLKTSNDRMLQQNEWDEEFALNLHDFDARMYDASIGRFWGVDVYAEKFSRFSPYHYGGNNPYTFVDPDGRAFFMAALLVGKFVGKKLAGSKIAASIAKAKAKVSKALKLSRVASDGSSQLTKFGKFMKSNFRPMAAGGRNVAANWDNISSREGSSWSGALHFGMGFGGAKLAMMAGESPGFWEELGYEGLGALAGGVGNMGVDAAFGVEGDVDYLRSFSRGVNSVISSKFDEKSFKKGMSGEVKKPGLLGFATNSTLNGLNLLAGKYGELGEESFKKAFGRYAPLRLFFAGAASSAIGDLLDRGWSPVVKSDGAHGFLFNYSIWTQAFFKNGSKTGLLYLIPEYDDYKKGKFLGPVISSGGANVGLQYLFSIMGFSSKR